MVVVAVAPSRLHSHGHLFFLADFSRLSSFVIKPIKINGAEDNAFFYYAVSSFKNKKKKKNVVA